MKFGVLLPHFGPKCSPEKLKAVAIAANELDFDSLWVRDHLYIPQRHRKHGGITERSFLEGLLSLTFVSSYAGDLILGTSVVNPHHHPLKLSQNLGTLHALAKGKVICGIGAGTFKPEFDAVGVPFEARGRIVEEMIDILRQTFSGSDVGYHGDHFEYEHVTINPRPGNEIPIWYGGGSRTAMHRAVEYADGWNLGRIPFQQMDDKLREFRALQDGRDRDLSTCMMPIFSIARTAEEAFDAVDMEAFIHDANELWGTSYTSKEDVEGSVAMGAPEDTVEMFERYADRGIDHVILDMRHSIDNMIELMELTHDEVLAAL
jgi:alkanesulfonate monooxygenase SsuD/methylene tetrahydromethanopterin reductase-like flavin-dependent oxidoreductase (luciferase family)